MSCELGPGSSSWRFLARFCSSWNWIHHSWALPTLFFSPVSRFAGSDLPSQPISPSFPQESLREGPRWSIWTPSTMASSELPPHPAVGTVSLLGVGGGAEEGHTKPWAGRKAPSKPPLELFGGHEMPKSCYVVWVWGVWRFFCPPPSPSSPLPSSLSGCSST